MEKKVKSFDGISIYYNIHSFSEKYIVLIHGAGGSKSAWQDVCKILHKQKISTITIDLRGHGKSGRPKSFKSYDLDNFAKDIYCVLKTENIHHFILVGHSFGGVVSITFHRIHPALAEAYIIIESAPKSPASIKYFFVINKPLMYVLNKVLERRDVAPLESDVDYERFKGGSDYDLNRISSDIASTGFKSWIFTYQSLASFNGKEVLSSIKQPVMIIQGDCDKIIAPETATEIASLIKESRIKIIPEANHMILLNDPKAVANEISDFYGTVFNSKE